LRVRQIFIKSGIAVKLIRNDFQAYTTLSSFDIYTVGSKYIYNWFRVSGGRLTITRKYQTSCQVDDSDRWYRVRISDMMDVLDFMIL
jgi:hypothetical protein